MATLHEVLREQVDVRRQEIADLVREHGSKVISQVTVEQAYGGMRGVRGLICDTSVVDPDKGLSVRGNHLLDIAHIWPEEMFFLLLTGRMPCEDGKKTLQMELDRRSQVPSYVWDVLRSMRDDTEPMCMLTTALTVMNTESVFRKWYDMGMRRDQYWLAMLEDGLNLLAKIPVIAAGIYRMRYNHGEPMHWTPGLDLAANYANMLGIADPEGAFAKMMRLFLTLHADHEGGNVSAFTCSTVGSALSDAYFSVASGLNGLAGPLHGLANQECIKWILDVMEKFGGVPTQEQIREFAWETLRAGRVIPGYGHAVLRVVDPRFTAIHAFGSKHIDDDPVFKTVDVVFEVVPKVLQEYSDERVKQGRHPIANIWPNVDAISGSMLYHFGLREMRYYTVLFAVSRVMGMIAQLILARAMGAPITRPKSVSTEWVLKQVNEQK